MARTKHIETNLPDKNINVIKNAESTATMAFGQPVILNLSSTKQPSTDQNGKSAGFEDGLQVVLPSTSNSAFGLNYFFYGINITPSLAPNQYGEAIIFGVMPSVIITKGSRSASTANWASSQSWASGLLLSVESGGNGLTSFSSSASLTATNQITQVQPYLCMLLDSIASQASSASATSDARTYITGSYRVFVRML